MSTSYEHPGHAAARKAREVAPLLDLRGWRDMPPVPASLPGETFIPGFVRQTTRSERKDVAESKQRRLFDV